ncbi:MAG: acetylornithine transaminase [Actinobacteria bacterium]|nr:acetylornithine transaminase [Actinomycetota bacterium]
MTTRTTAVAAQDGLTTASVQERWRGSLMDNYGTPPIALVRGRGARVWDVEGREYVDLLAGIAVNALGHAHPDVVTAVAEQAGTLGHTSNLAMTLPAIALAERLVALLDPSGEREGRVFFCNSGAEANEAAFKLTRRTGRTRVVVAERSFHGRTMGALALTAQPPKQDPFRPLPGEVMTVPFGDIDSLRAAVDGDTAAVFLEPIQGEGGVIPAPAGYLSAAREACDAHGALLVLDEVQTGIGRTGAWFAHHAEGVSPDVVTLAKGLGGGLPIGACIAFGQAASLLGPGSHGSTFGGNPVSCAAALAVLDVIERDGLVDRARVAGERLTEIVTGASHVSHVRGRGLLLGAVLTEPRAADLEASARAHGLLVNAVASDVIRLAPPLVLDDDDLALVAERWPLAVGALT